MRARFLIVALLSFVASCGSDDDGGTGGAGGTAGEAGAAGAGGGSAACGPVAAGTRKDVAYDMITGVDPSLLSLDIYTPDSDDSCAKLPIVVWVHGGGWAIGDKSNKMSDKITLFNAAGWVLISLNYRLSPNPPTTDPNAVRYPIHPKDVASAVHWIKSHPAEVRGDVNRLALLGHSAGAHLVALLSTDESFLDAHSDALSTVRCTGSFDTEAYDIPAALSSPTAQQKAILENAFGTDPAVQANASPVNHVAAGKGIPPFLIAVRGGADREATQKAFQKKLSDAGIKADAIDATSLTHEQVNDSIGAAGDTIMTPKVMEFLNSCFAAP